MSEAKIFITGASTGIGKALAELYAAPGVTLGLLARRKHLLEALKPELEERGARVLLYPADVRDAAAMAAAADAFVEAAGGVSLVIANAGVASGGGITNVDVNSLAEVISINVQGVLHTLAPMVPHMMKHRRGHLVTIGSVAGFRGLPGRADYNASKAAVKTLMDGFRMELKPYGIRVTTICPGFVESEMTARNRFHMPFFLKADRAARVIARAIRGNRKTYVFPWQWRLLLPLIVRAPDWMVPDPR
jgi:short-subunit dehydrogenase